MSENHPVPEWAKLLPEGEFISYLPSYVGGKYFDLFDEFTFPCEETGGNTDVAAVAPKAQQDAAQPRATGAITYYVYDPVKHGADPSGKYPVLLWLHGATNGLNGTFCICNCGGELFASPEYQAAMGGGNTDVAAVAPKAQQDAAQPRATGAYVVVPLANEKMDENGKLTETFSEKYFKPLKGIVERVQKGGSTSKVFAMGGSLGGWMTWKMAEEFPEMFGGIIPISTSYIPTDEQLENIARHKIAVYFTLGQHDETLDFAKDIAPRIPKMEELGFTCFFPEWVKNGDGGVASLFYGWEMGQHCMINQVQANLMYDDGTPYDPRLPNGVCGWIKDVCTK